MSDLVSFAFSSAEKKSMIDVLEKYRKNEVVDALIEILYMPGEIPLTVTDALILGGLVRPYYGFIADRILDHPAIKELLEDTSGKMRQALALVPPLLKEIRGFANDAFGGPSSLTDCLDLVLTQAEDALKSATD